MVEITAKMSALLDETQRQTLRYFTEFAHPVSGLARDRSNPPASDPNNDKITIGGTGFGLMCLIVGVSRGWIDRTDAVRQIRTMLAFLSHADRFLGAFPHFIDGSTGRVIPYDQDDDGADLVETAYLVMGLRTVVVFFNGDDADETAVRDEARRISSDVQWNSFVASDRRVLLWHWSPKRGFAKNVGVVGWNECLIVYVLAAIAGPHAIDPEVYHIGWTSGPTFSNGRTYFDVSLPLGPALGGPLFFSHYSFLGLDPFGLVDRYADYGIQNRAHALINFRHCVQNPHGHSGYGPHCWGLTASDGNRGYEAHAPTVDRGVIAPTAALSSMPYLPDEACAALRFFRHGLTPSIWTRFGFMDAFNAGAAWRSHSHLAIDQGPIVNMIENFRSGLLWRLFMSDPEVQSALHTLGFTSPRITSRLAI